MEKEKNVCVIPEVLTMKGSRRIVMKQTWQEASEKEKEGTVITPEEFGKILHETWLKIKTDEIPKAKADLEACIRSCKPKKEAEKPKKTEEKAENKETS